MRILHIDMNSFFASCEVSANPSLDNKPVIVAGIDGNRGVVTTASYEARRYGIKAGMPTREAIRLCPSVIALRPNFELYKKYSVKIMSIFKQYTTLVEQASIDEAYLDISSINVDPVILAKQIQRQIQNDLKLGCSIGIAQNKYFAKLGSDIKKPNGITLIHEQNFKTIIWNLKIEDAKYIGRKTIPLLKQFNIKTIGEFAKMNSTDLAVISQNRSRLKIIHNYVNGLDYRKVEIHTQNNRKSIGLSSTFDVDTNDAKLVIEKLRMFSDKIAENINQLNIEAYTITLTLRYTGFITKSHSKSSTESINLANEIFILASHLFQKHWNNNSLRLVGIQLSNLRKNEYKQIKIISY
jgi:DNA polymerase-4